MPLTVVTGPANAGKTGWAYDALRRAHSAGADSVLLLPSEPDVQRARDELSTEIPLGLRVSTFERYVRATWAAYGDGRRVVSAVERRLLLLEMAENGNAISAGMIALAERVIEQLADTLGDGWAGRVPPQPTTETLEHLLSSYASVMAARSLVEAGEAAAWLSRRGTFGADVLVAHRFTDLASSQEALLMAASKSGLEVVVTLPWTERSAAAEALTPLVERMSREGSVVAVQDEAVGTDGELVRIARDIFGSPTPQVPTSAVSLLEAEGDENAADAVTAEVLAAVSAGVPAEQVAVVFRDPARHVDALASAFKASGLAADFDVRAPLSLEPLGRAFLQLLGYITEEDATALVGFVRSPYSGVSLERARAFESDVRASRHADPGRWLSDLAKGSSEAARSVRMLRKLNHTGVTEEGAAVMVEAVRRMMGCAYAAMPDESALASDARVASAIQTLVETAVSVTERPPALKTVRALLAQHAMTSPSVERPGHVQVTSVDRVRARRFDTLVIGGLEAGEFPAQADDVFESGGVLGSMLEARGAAARHGRGPQFERLLFYQAVTRPRRRLVLVRRRSDSAGNMIGPSPFWEEILDFYRVREPDDETADSEGETLICDAVAMTSGPRSEMRAAAACGETGADPRVAGAMQRATPLPPAIGDPLVVRDLEARAVFSPSEIESYLACPLRWFYQRVISPQRFDYEFDASERGRLVHSMLHEAYESIVTSIPEGRVTLSNLDVCRTLASEACAIVIGRIEAPADVEAEWDRRDLTRRVDAFVQRDATLLPGEYAPLLLETRLGPEEGVSFGSFSLTGRVDRLDSSGTHAVIVDYKSGDVPTRAALLGKGRIQLHLYAEMARRELGLEPAGALYWSLKAGKARGLVDDGLLGSEGFVRSDRGDRAQFDEEVEAALALAETAVEGIRSGSIDPTPDPDVCKWCEARGYCERTSLCTA